MSDPAALKLLREIATDSTNIIFTKHALQRMRERKVTTAQVIAWLASGCASEPVALDLHGNWKLTVTQRVAGAELNVSVAIDAPSRAIVITVFGP